MSFEFILFSLVEKKKSIIVLIGVGPTTVLLKPVAVLPTLIRQ